MGRYDSGRATMGEVVLKGGMAAFQVISVALPVGKGLTALGRAGATFLAADVAAMETETVAASVGSDAGAVAVDGGGEQTYRIQDGVRRARAALEAEHDTIAARELYPNGKLGPVRQIPLRVRKRIISRL